MKSYFGRAVLVALGTAGVCLVLFSVCVAFGALLANTSRGAKLFFVMTPIVVGFALIAASGVSWTNGEVGTGRSFAAVFARAMMWPGILIALLIGLPALLGLSIEASFLVLLALPLGVSVFKEGRELLAARLQSRASSD